MFKEVCKDTFKFIKSTLIILLLMSLFLSFIMYLDIKVLLFNIIVALKIMSIYPYLGGYELYDALPMLLRALSDPFMIFIIIVTVLLENALIGSYFYNLKKLYYNEESGWTI